MITGHLGVAWYARARRPEPAGSLPFSALIVASLLPDGGDALLSAAAVCNRYGVSTHSIPGIAALSAVAWVASWTLWRNAGFSWVMAAVVALHMPADWITGEKILWAGGPVLRLNLYRWPWADFLLEAPIVCATWVAYSRRNAPPRWASRRAALAGLLAFQAAFDIAAPYMKSAGTSARRRACGPVATEQAR